LICQPSLAGAVAGVCAGALLLTTATIASAVNTFRLADTMPP
jgi:hypothetical protein